MVRLLQRAAATLRTVSWRPLSLSPQVAYSASGSTARNNAKASSFLFQALRNLSSTSSLFVEPGKVVVTRTPREIPATRRPTREEIIESATRAAEQFLASNRSHFMKLEDSPVHPAISKAMGPVWYLLEKGDYNGAAQVMCERPQVGLKDWEVFMDYVWSEGERAQIDWKFNLHVVKSRASLLVEALTSVDEIPFDTVVSALRRIATEDPMQATVLYRHVIEKYTAASATERAKFSEAILSGITQNAKKVVELWESPVFHDHQADADYRRVSPDAKEYLQEHHIKVIGADLDLEPHHDASASLETFLEEHRGKRNKYELEGIADNDPRLNRRFDAPMQFVVDDVNYERTKLVEQLLGVDEDGKLAVPAEVPDEFQLYHDVVSREVRFMKKMREMIAPWRATLNPRDKHTMAHRRKQFVGHVYRLVLVEEQLARSQADGTLPSDGVQLKAYAEQLYADLAKQSGDAASSATPLTAATAPLSDEQLAAMSEVERAIVEFAFADAAGSVLDGIPETGAGKGSSSSSSMASQFQQQLKLPTLADQENPVGAFMHDALASGNVYLGSASKGRLLRMQGDLMTLFPAGKIIPREEIKDAVIEKEVGRAQSQIQAIGKTLRFLDALAVLNPSKQMEALSTSLKQLLTIQLLFSQNEFSPYAASYPQERARAHKESFQFDASELIDSVAAFVWGTKQAEDALNSLAKSRLRNEAAVSSAASFKASDLVNQLKALRSKQRSSAIANLSPSTSPKAASSPASLPSESSAVIAAVTDSLLAQMGIPANLSFLDGVYSDSNYLASLFAQLQESVAPADAVSLLSEGATGSKIARRALLSMGQAKAQQVQLFSYALLTAISGSADAEEMLQNILGGDPFVAENPVTYLSELREGNVDLQLIPGIDTLIAAANEATAGYGNLGVSVDACVDDCIATLFESDSINPVLASKTINAVTAVADMLAHRNKDAFGSAVENPRLAAAWASLFKRAMSDEDAEVAALLESAKDAKAIVSAMQEGGISKVVSLLKSSHGVDEYVGTSLSRSPVATRIGELASSVPGLDDASTPDDVLAALRAVLAGSDGDGQASIGSAAAQGIVTILSCADFANALTITAVEESIANAFARGLGEHTPEASTGTGTDSIEKAKLVRNDTPESMGAPRFLREFFTSKGASVGARKIEELRSARASTPNTSLLYSPRGPVAAAAAADLEDVETTGLGSKSGGGIVGNVDVFVSMLNWPTCDEAKWARVKREDKKLLGVPDLSFSPPTISPPASLYSLAIAAGKGRFANQMLAPPARTDFVAPAVDAAKSSYSAFCVENGILTQEQCDELLSGSLSSLASAVRADAFPAFSPDQVRAYAQRIGVAAYDPLSDPLGLSAILSGASTTHSLHANGAGVFDAEAASWYHAANTMSIYDAARGWLFAARYNVPHKFGKMGGFADHSTTSAIDMKARKEEGVWVALMDVLACMRGSAVPMNSSHFHQLITFFATRRDIQRTMELLEEAKSFNVSIRSDSLLTVISAVAATQSSMSEREVHGIASTLFHDWVESGRYTASGPNDSLAISLALCLDSLPMEWSAFLLSRHKEELNYLESAKFVAHEFKDDRRLAAVAPSISPDALLAVCGEEITPTATLIQQLLRRAAAENRPDIVETGLMYARSTLCLVDDETRALCLKTVPSSKRLKARRLFEEIDAEVAKQIRSYGLQPFPFMTPLGLSAMHRRQQQAQRKSGGSSSSGNRFS